MLTADGQRIDKGLVWRIYQGRSTPDAKSTLLNTYRDATPLVRLEPGDYVVNAAFGRAHLTRRISVKPGAPAPDVEQFVLNAGGIRVKAMLGNKPAPPGSVTYTVYSDRDQTDNRTVILSGAKPGLIVRLNAGIYNITSSYGDANSIVRSDITVEAGKLTEATLVHSFAKATFKLCKKAGGEALPDTQWEIQTQQGDTVKESVGALPVHILAPGSYIAIARSARKTFRRDFTVRDGEIVQVEVVSE